MKHSMYELERCTSGNIIIPIHIICGLGHRALTFSGGQSTLSLGHGNFDNLAVRGVYQSISTAFH